MGFFSSLCTLFRTQQPGFESWLYPLPSVTQACYLTPCAPLSSEDKDNNTHFFTGSLEGLNEQIHAKYLNT